MVKIQKCTHYVNINKYYFVRKITSIRLNVSYVKLMKLFYLEWCPNIFIGKEPPKYIYLIKVLLKIPSHFTSS